MYITGYEVCDRYFCVLNLECCYFTVDEMMVALLDSGQREVVYCACGVLVNLMADPTHRDMLATNSGVRK